MAIVRSGANDSKSFEDLSWPHKQFTGSGCSIQNQIGPDLRKLRSSLKVFCPIIGGFDLIFRRVRQHQINDCTISRKSLVHHRTESRTPAVRHMFVVIASTVQQIANGVFGHWLVSVPGIGQSQGTATCQPLECLYRLNGLARQRNKVIPALIVLVLKAKLHPLRWDLPNTLTEAFLVQFRPWSGNQCAWPHCCQSKDAQRKFCHWMAWRGSGWQ